MFLTLKNIKDTETNSIVEKKILFGNEVRSETLILWLSQRNILKCAYMYLVEGTVGSSRKSRVKVMGALWQPESEFHLTHIEGVHLGAAGSPQEWIPHAQA